MGPFDALKDRFGEDGLKELAIMDMRAHELMTRLYLFTSICANVKQFDEKLGDDFYVKVSPHINELMEEMDTVLQDFQKRRGEV